MDQSPDEIAHLMKRADAMREADVNRAFAALASLGGALCDLGARDGQISVQVSGETFATVRTYAARQLMLAPEGTTHDHFGVDYVQIAGVKLHPPRRPAVVMMERQPAHTTGEKVAES